MHQLLNGIKSDTLYGKSLNYLHFFVEPEWHVIVKCRLFLRNLERRDMDLILERYTVQNYLQKRKRIKAVAFYSISSFKFKKKRNFHRKECIDQDLIGQTENMRSIQERQYLIQEVGYRSVGRIRRDRKKKKKKEGVGPRRTKRVIAKNYRSFLDGGCKPASAYCWICWFKLHALRGAAPAGADMPPRFSYRRSCQHGTGACAA